MSDKKLLCTDVDGTLLSGDGNVTEENRRALSQALGAGHKVAIVTGRSITGARPVIEKLDLDRDGVYLLAYQGSQIYDCGRKKLIWQDGISGEIAAELLLALREEGIYGHTFSEEGILTLQTGKELEQYGRQTPEPYRVMKDISELKGRIVPKVMAIDFETDEKLLRFQEQFKAKEAGRLNSFFSDTCYLEYCKKGCHKGNGLKQLASILHWDLNNVIAVGDERNDIPMIETAGIGVAMCNGRAEVKAAADYITEADCDHSGVAEVIDRFVLNQ